MCLIIKYIVDLGILSNTSIQKSPVIQIRILATLLKCDSSQLKGISSLLTFDFLILSSSRSRSWSRSGQVRSSSRAPAAPLPSLKTAQNTQHIDVFLGKPYNVCFVSNNGHCLVFKPSNKSRIQVDRVQKLPKHITIPLGASAKLCNIYISKDEVSCF